MNNSRAIGAGDEVGFVVAGVYCVSIYMYGIIWDGSGLQYGERVEIKTSRKLSDAAVSFTRT